LGSRGAAKEDFKSGRLITRDRCRPSGAHHLRRVDPRLAKPRLGLNSDRCSAARWVFTFSWGTTTGALLCNGRRARPVIQTDLLPEKCLIQLAAIL